MKLSMPVQTNEDGSVKSVAPKAVEGARYELLHPRFYHAVVTFGSEAEGTYESKAGVTYAKLTPQVQIVVGERDEANVWKESRRVKLNPQDLTVGAVDASGALYRPNGDGKNPLFGGISGARQILQNMGFAKIDGNNVVIDFDASIIRNRVMNVFVGLAAYIPANEEEGTKSQNWDADQLREWLKGQTGLKTDEEVKKLDFETIQDLANDAGMKLKNVITFWGAFKQVDAERFGYYFDSATGAVFETTEDYTTYKGLQGLSGLNTANESLSAL